MSIVFSLGLFIFLLPFLPLMVSPQYIQTGWVFFITGPIGIFMMFIGFVFSPWYVKRAILLMFLAMFLVRNITLLIRGDTSSSVIFTTLLICGMTALFIWMHIAAQAEAETQKKDEVIRREDEKKFPTLVDPRFMTNSAHLLSRHQDYKSSLIDVARARGVPLSVIALLEAADAQSIKKVLQDHDLNDLLQ